VANKLFIGGLSFDTNDGSLKTFFEQAGAVESAAVITDRFSGKSRGFGFVEMSSSAEGRCPQALRRARPSTLSMARSWMVERSMSTRRASAAVAAEVETGGNAGRRQNRHY
jgi:hypothetical protein